MRWCVPTVVALASFASGAAIACGRTVEGHGVTAELTCEPFQKAKHRLTFQNGALIRIDGLNYSGTDGSVPKLAVRSFRLRIDGIEFTVPRELLRSLYEPHVPPHAMNTLSVQRTNDLVLAEFTGGDGAGAYRTMWVVNTSSGQLTRVLYEQPDPDKAKLARVQLKPNLPIQSDAQRARAADFSR